MDIDNIFEELKNISPKKLMIGSTIRYLSSLPDVLAEATYKAAILRWFNVKVLGGIMKEDDESQTTTATSSPEILYAQLQKLPFTEEYPGRGHSFHELTRKMILEYLWDQKTDFYRQVSNHAMTYFSKIMDIQSDQLDNGEIEPDQLDAGIAVEYAYHYIIVDEENAVAEIDGFLEEMIFSNQMGIYHDMLEAVAEHAKADRLSSDWAPFVEYWQLKEAHLNFDFDQLEKKAQELLQFPDTDTSRFLKADAIWYLADGFRLNSQYDEARQNYEESIRRCEELEDEDRMQRAVMGLGNLANDMELPSQAVDYYSMVLSYKVQQLRGPATEGAEYGDDTPLKVFYPNAWHRREITFVDKAEDQIDKVVPESGDQSIVSEEGEAATQEPHIQYFVELDIDQDGLVEVDSGEDEISLPEWRVDIDATLAELWYKLGFQQEALGFVGNAGLCGELAAQMYLDLGDLTSAQSVLQMLERLAKAVVNPEYIKHIQDLRDQLISEADAIGDQDAKLAGLIDQARSYYDREQYSLAREKYEAVYAQAEELELDNARATCLEGLALVRWVDGDYPEAKKQFHRALDLYQEAQNKHGQAWILVSLGDLHLLQRRFSEAIDNFKVALETYRTLGSISGQFESLARLSDAAQAQGDYEKAFDYLKQTLDLAQKDQGLLLETSALSEIGKLYLSLGNDSKAKEAFKKALDISRQMEQRSKMTQILHNEANILQDLAEYARVVDLSDQIIAIDPSLHIAYHRKGWALLHLGKQHALEAKAALEKAVEQVPDDWWAHKEIANALWSTGDYESARAKYQWVIGQIEQKDVQSLLPTLGWSYYKLGEYEKAKKIYNEIVSSDPDPVSDYFDLGLVYLCLGKFDEALHEYKRSLTYLEKKNPIRMRLGPLHVAMFDLREAIETTPKLADVKECLEIQKLLKDTWASVSEWNAPKIEIELDNADRCNHRALVYAGFGDEQAAIAEYSRAIALDPDQADFYANRALSYIALEQPEPNNALVDLTKAIELDTQNPDRYYDRVQFHIQQENYKEALADINQALKLRPEDVELIATRAGIYRYLDSDDDVQADLARIIELMPDSPEGYYIRAEYYTDIGNYQAAIRDYSNVIELQPDNAEHYNSRANLSANLGDWQAALTDYNQAIRLKPDFPVFYTNRAQAYAILEKTEEARADLTKAIEIEPKNAEHYNFRAQFHIQQENYKEALADINQALKLRPEDVTSLAWRAKLQAESGKSHAALEDYSQAIKLNEDEDPSLYSARALVFSNLEKYPEALADFNRSIELQPEYGHFYHFRALTNIDIGDYEAGLSDLDSADKLDKENKESICFNLVWRGLIYRLTDRQEEARQVWKQACEIAEGLPDPVNQHRLLALATMYLGDTRTSRKHYQTLFKQNPTPYHIYMQRNYLHRSKRLLPDRTDISKMVEWFERKRHSNY